ncbi:MAG: formate-nitrite transporter family protein [Pyrinomonadaceae bacterium]|jgi:protein-disulfide isomerase|nr:formate-nitrite transporter family protein [Pyrinomonadaceae bacterium]
MRRKLPIIIIVLVLVAALAGGALMMRTPQTSTTQTNIAQLPPTVTTSSAPAANATPRPAAATPPANLQNVHVRGRTDAPLLLEEYGDFQCPPCGFFHPILKRIEGEYATQLRVAYRHFPIRSQHQHAAEAARAAEAAALQGKFWQMHDMLFENQKDWKDAPIARPVFLNFARTLGLDVAKFTQDIDSAAVANRVLNDETQAAARGVKGTPSVYLNGREIPFEVITNYDSLRATIERELAAK